MQTEKSALLKIYIQGSNFREEIKTLHIPGDDEEVDDDALTLIL